MEMEGHRGLPVATHSRATGMLMTNQKSRSVSSDRSSRIFCSTLENSYARQLDSPVSLWSQDRIYMATVSVAGKSTCQSYGLRTSRRVSASRSSKVIEEKSHHTGSSSGGSIHFLSVFNSKEIRRASADHKSSSAKQVCALSTLQDGRINLVKDLLNQDDFLGSIDLKDAYLMVPIHMEHRKYLRVCFSLLVSPSAYQALQERLRKFSNQGNSMCVLPR